MFTKLYTYLINYKNEKIEVTTKSTLFQKYVNIYNDTIYKLIHMLHKITYIPPKSNEPDIKFHEDCVYY